MKITQLSLGTSNSNVGDSFFVSHLELINSGLLRLWFNKQPANANDPSKYALDGIVPSLAQTTTGSAPFLSVDIYTPISVGQHTLVLSPTIALASVTPTVYLNSLQIVFEVADDVVQDTIAAQENSVKSFLPKQFKNKTNWDALSDALQYGDDLVATQARDTHDQMSLATATNGSLTKKAGDLGIKRHSKLGLSDDDFRNLAISVHSEKLTSQSILNVLEILYGEGSVHSYIESQNVEPFSIGMECFRTFTGPTVTTNTLTPFDSSTDPFWSNTSALLHLDSRTLDSGIRYFFTDEKGRMFWDDALVSSSTKKLGAGAAFFNGPITLYSGNTIISCLVPLQGDEAFKFRTGDFTVECWVNPNRRSTYDRGGGPLGSWSGDVGWRIRVDTSGIVQFQANNINYPFSFSLDLNTWTHLAVSRKGSVLRCFKDGTVVATYSCSLDIGQNTLYTSLCIGHDQQESSDGYFFGYIDEVRVTKACRYETDFLPNMVSQTVATPYLPSLIVKTDQKVETAITIPQNNFENPFKVTAQELCACFNIEFQKLNALAVAKVHKTQTGNKVRIYSLTRGDKSTISCLGGTFQPFLIFDDIVSARLSSVYQGDVSWLITTPTPGIVRFEEDPLDPGTTDITNLRIGDYVLINGPQFDPSLWGTHEIVNVDFRVIAGTNHKYFEIEA